jgi:hypothetical protein
LHARSESAGRAKTPPTRSAERVRAVARSPLDEPVLGAHGITLRMNSSKSGTVNAVSP